MTRLDDGAGLAILGGRDEVGGGTWLATNEAGVVAGLTNRPMRDGPDAAKRSRGELPLALAAHPSAATAVEAFGRTIDPQAYNPSWLLVADPTDAFFVDVTGTDTVVVEPLPAGVHVLENRHLHEPSPKVDRVRQLLAPVLDGPPDDIAGALAALLADHHVPTDEPPEDSANPRLARAARAICVHADDDDYGTRSAAIITAGTGIRPPTIRWSADPPCAQTWHVADDRWVAGPAGATTDPSPATADPPSSPAA
jgi:uncharacterized protein with NRDE domain